MMEPQFCSGLAISPVVSLYSMAMGSQGRPEAASSMMSGQASPVAHLKKNHHVITPKVYATVIKVELYTVHVHRPKIKALHLKVGK